jgi:hypothetical protein
VQEISTTTSRKWYVLNAYSSFYPYLMGQYSTGVVYPRRDAVKREIRSSGRRRAKDEEVEE